MFHSTQSLFIETFLTLPPSLWTTHVKIKLILGAHKYTYVTCSYLHAIHIASGIRSVNLDILCNTVYPQLKHQRVKPLE